MLRVLHGLDTKKLSMSKCQRSRFSGKIELGGQHIPLLPRISLHSLEESRLRNAFVHDIHHLLLVYLPRIDQLCR